MYKINTFSWTSARNGATHAPPGVTRAQFLNFGKGLEPRAPGNEFTETPNEVTEKDATFWCYLLYGSSTFSVTPARKIVTHAPFCNTRPVREFW